MRSYDQISRRKLKNVPRITFRNNVLLDTGQPIENDGPVPGFHCTRRVSDFK